MLRAVKINYLNQVTLLKIVELKWKRIPIYW